MQKNGFSAYKNHLLVALVIIPTWLIITDATQYLLTEPWYLRNSIPDSWKLGFILSLLLLGLVKIRFLEKRGYKANKSGLIITGIFFLLTLFAHQRYVKFYLQLQTVPKIKSISKNWTIQGDRIAIEGRNFSSHWQDEARVAVGEVEFNIVSWSNRRIVVEQPLSDQYFTDMMIVCNRRGNCTEIGEFTIKDPAEVL